MLPMMTKENINQGVFFLFVFTKNRKYSAISKKKKKKKILNFHTANNHVIQS